MNKEPKLETQWKVKGYILTKDHTVCEAKVIGCIGGEFVIRSELGGCQTIPPCEFFHRELEAYDKAIWLVKGEMERCAQEIAKWSSKLDALKTLYGLSVENKEQ